MSYFNNSGGGPKRDRMMSVLTKYCPLMVLSTMVMVVVLLLALVVAPLITSDDKDRFGQPNVGLIDQTAAGPNLTRLDSANQGAGTYDAPLGTPEYSDEAAQVANAQLAKARAGFTSRFYSSRDNGPAARYVPYKEHGQAPDPAASTERMSHKSNQEAKLLATMQGR
jgi:hypothetical protein